MINEPSMTTTQIKTMHRLSENEYAGLVGRAKYCRAFKDGLTMGRAESVQLKAEIEKLEKQIIGLKNDLV